MIHHIVMFKLLETSDTRQKEAHKQEVKERLERLPTEIDVIRSMEVGINVVAQARHLMLSWYLPSTTLMTWRPTGYIPHTRSL